MDSISATAPLRFAGHSLDPARSALLRPDGVEVVLRPKTYAVLHRLVLARGAALSRQALLDDVWRGLAVTDDSLTQCISEIRRALGTNAGLVRTLARRGYLLDIPGAPEPIPPETAAPVRRRPWIAWTLAGLGAAGASVALVTRPPQTRSPPPPAIAADLPLQRRSEAERLTEEGRLLVTGALTSERTFAARERFLAAIAIDPSYGPAHSRAALTYTNSVISRWSTDPEGDLRRASELAERGAMLDPDHLATQVARGALLRLRGRHEEALEAYRRAAAMDPVAGITSLANTGLMLILLGQPVEAQEPLLRALGLAPTHPFRFTWLTHLGTARLHAGDFAEAAAALAQGLDGTSHVPVVERRMMLAAALALRGDVAAASRLAALARESQPEVTLGMLRAQAASTHPAYLAQREDSLIRGLALAGLPG